MCHFFIHFAGKCGEQPRPQPAVKWWGRMKVIGVILGLGVVTGTHYKEMLYFGARTVHQGCRESVSAILDGAGR